nr:flagella basal body P-ring formation protein FlgA [uncultured Sphingosinicella sp.]
MTSFRRSLPVLLLLAGTAAHAQGFEDLAALDRKIAATLGADAGEPGGPARTIDKRLKLAACSQPAIIDPPAMGAVLVRCEPLGWRIRVALVRPAAGYAQAAAKAEPLVRKGDQVELTASSGSFSVSTVAVAEQDGAPGDRIRVRSEGKKGAVIGMVTPDGRVTLPGFK